MPCAVNRRTDRRVHHTTTSFGCAWRSRPQTSASGTGILLTNEMLWSERAKAIAGLPPNEPVTFELIRDITHPEDHPWTSAKAREALDPKVRRRDPYEYRIVRPDGTERLVVAHGEAIFDLVDGAERAVRYVGTLRDVTARRRMEATLRESEARLRLAIDAARLGIWEHDGATDTTTISPETNRILGLPDDQPFDVGVLAYYPGDREKLRDAGATAIARGERFFQTEIRYRHPVRGVLWLLVRAEILFGKVGEVRGAIGVVMDITDRKAAEEQQSSPAARTRSPRQKHARLCARHCVVDAAKRRGPGGGGASTGGPAHGPRSRAWPLECGPRGRSAAASRRHRRDHQTAPNGTAEPHQGRWRGRSVGRARDRGIGTGCARARDQCRQVWRAFGAQGQVDISWTVERADVPKLIFRWRERNGPTIAAPTRRGFGTTFVKEASRRDSTLRLIWSSPVAASRVLSKCRSGNAAHRPLASSPASDHRAPGADTGTVLKIASAAKPFAPRRIVVQRNRLLEGFRIRGSQCAVRLSPCLGSALTLQTEAVCGET